MPPSSCQSAIRAQLRRLVGWVVLIAFVWGWLAGLAHLCAEHHRLCAAHGVVEHGVVDLHGASAEAPHGCHGHGHELAEAPLAGRDGRAAPHDDGTQHEACALLLLVQAKGVVVAQHPAPIASVAPVAFVAFVRAGVSLAAPATVARPPFTYAPKHSPPCSA